jgi:hypothetical protein
MTNQSEYLIIESKQMPFNCLSYAVSHVQENVRVVPQIRSRPLPSTPFPINLSLTSPYHLMQYSHSY